MLRRLAIIAATILFPVACDRDPGGPAAPSPPEPDPEPVTWNAHVRPVLAGKCFRCHGPGKETNPSELQLDTAAHAGAFIGESGSCAVVPGEPDASRLWQRVSTTDPEEAMPPPESGMVLSARERETIREWIRQGAEYEPHWSFLPLPSRVPLPAAPGGTWSGNSIDRFVLARLDEDKLIPSAPAAPKRWLRRAALDLTGIPPTEKQSLEFQDSFIRDPEGALLAETERLLSSPAFGERLGELWLETIGYADSADYGSGEENTRWLYRDWVVRAFNENLRFNRFLGQQVAGDLFDDPEQDEILATAFCRLDPLDETRNTDPDHWLIENSQSRLRRFGSSFLGLDLECARCHQHPYDPLSPRDYYGLLAFFNSIDESPPAANGPRTPRPSMFLPTTGQAARLHETRIAISELTDRLAALPGEHADTFQAWLDTGEVVPVIADTVGIFTFDERKPAVPNRALGANLTGAAAGLDFAEGVHGEALRLDGAEPLRFPEFPGFDRWTPWTFSFWILDPGTNEGAVTLLSRTEGAEPWHHGFDLVLARGALTARIFHHWPGNALAIRSSEAVIPPGTWTHLTWRYDGSGSGAGMGLFVDGRPVEAGIIADHIRRHAVGAASDSAELLVGTGFRDGLIDDFHIYSRALTDLEVLHLYNNTSLSVAAAEPDEHLETLRGYYFSGIDPAARKLREELTVTRRELVMVEDTVPEVSIMKERPEPRPAYVLPGGDPGAHHTGSDRVPRSTPSFLPPLHGPDNRGVGSAPPSRLDLALWLTSSEHPLTARVFVNRIWAHFFGRGLVATLNDFGNRGAAPTHPDLLDWLSRDFVKSGWDVKQLCRQIVHSNTYRQDSLVRSDLLEIDPGNLLLARGPARPLTQAELRDLALAASGILEEQAGGPPVAPALPHGSAARHPATRPNPALRTFDRSLLCRSLYSEWRVPSARPVRRATKVQTDRELCPVDHSPRSPARRSLLLLEEAQRLMASRALAQRILKADSKDDDARLTSAFLALTGQPPGSKELLLLNYRLVEQREHFDDAHPDSPRMVQSGNAEADPGIDPQELATWTIICQTILDLDAARWKR